MAGIEGNGGISVKKWEQRKSQDYREPFPGAVGMPGILKQSEAMGILEAWKIFKPIRELGLLKNTGKFVKKMVSKNAGISTACRYTGGGARKNSSR